MLRWDNTKVDLWELNERLKQGVVKMEDMPTLDNKNR